MCAKSGGPVNPSQVKVQLRVEPSGLSRARNVPLAPVPFGGTSLNVERFVEKKDRRSLSSLALAARSKAPATMKAPATATAIFNVRFFMFSPPETTGK